ncbi:MAG TPA: RNA methyltransferase [Burkholderiales bacterium]|nr:RNA methyltransferase [Burkholderiales bacterium]
MSDPGAPDGATALARVRIVLSHTTHPGNIGAAARALKTMGLARLVLVNPRHFPDPQAEAMAVGADDVLGAARVCASVDEALAGTTLAIALTARRRDLSPLALDARDAARLAAAEAAGGGEVAFVFGTEMSGLSNEDVIRCQRVAHIAASPAFSSLNLAASVQVVAYETRVAAVGGAAVEAERTPAATHEEVEGFFAHLEASVIRSGFLDSHNRRRLMERLRRLFGRVRLESQEVNILRGMLSAWDQGPHKKS